MSLSDRQKLILRTLIKDYVKNVQPVSSGILVEKYNLGISPATTRNELMFLEERGYIYQPHTSAGRIPTASAYYLDFHSQLEQKRDLKGGDRIILERSLEESPENFKATARSLADLSSNAVFWAFHKNDLYYTGLSNLFSQAEFKHSDIVCDASQVIDRMEEIIDGIFDDLNDDVNAFIGENNPFGAFLGTVVLKYKKNGIAGLVGVLGPLRMDYYYNFTLLSYLQSKLK